jgi:hypothetical protein
MKITEKIDERIEELTNKRRFYINIKRDIQFANEIWSRIEELRQLKSLYTDKEGNWKI